MAGPAADIPPRFRARWSGWPACLPARPPARTSTRPTWSVQATVDEPTELLCAFVAHYLDLGAEEVILHLDRPRKDQMAVLGAVPGVRLVACTRGWWLRRRGLRPKTHVARQVTNATHAYRRCRSDWMLACDADEFLLPDRPVAEILAAADPALQYLRIDVAERVFEADRPPVGIFDGLFRLAVRSRAGLVARVYGAAAPFLRRGLSADSIGKCMTRTGLDARIWLHNPLPRGVPLVSPASRLLHRQPFQPGLRLLHFDGLTPLHWRLKLMRKLLRDRPLSASTRGNNGKGRPAERRAQLDAVFDGRNDPARLAALTALQRLDPRQIGLLDHAGLILRADADPAAAALRRFPEAGLDFSLARFDAQLLRLYPEAMATLAPA